MHWRKGHESDARFLRSSDLYLEADSKAAGRAVYGSPVVEIERMSRDKVKSRERPNGEGRNFAWFKGKGKPLALNVTNCQTIESLAGNPDTESWVGLTIQLHVDPAARYPNGKTGPAIRIKPRRPTGPADTAPLPEHPPDVQERLDAEHDERLRDDGEREPGQEGE